MRASRARRLLKSRLFRLLIAAVLIVTGVTLLTHHSTPVFTPSLEHIKQETQDSIGWLEAQVLRGGSIIEEYWRFIIMDKPKDVKVVGLVFYGRRRYVEILDQYLRRNLAVNGGWLDEVRFVMHTDVQEDIDWLEDLVKRESLQDHYKILYEHYTIQGTVWGTFPKVYEAFATDPDALYIKMDDDLVFIDENAIPRIVSSLLAHPEAHSIQSNSINNRWNHYFHYGAGAILPYLPEPFEAPPDPREPDWRASSLPPYPVDTLPPGREWYIPKSFVPPFQGHRWLPLPRTEENSLRTPFGDGLRLPDPTNSTRRGPPGWQIASQEHYSFFEHLENNNLAVYAWGNPSDGLWNTRYQHYNIHFMAFWGSTMAKRPFWGEEGDEQFIRNDEVALTMTIPKELAMPVLVDTRVMVCHFGFHDAGQREGLLKTDVLERYRALAKEITASPLRNQTRPSLQTGGIATATTNGGG